MAKVYTEATFEELIENHLLKNGYEKGDADSFDRETCLDKEVFLNFIKETQSKNWAYLEKTYGKDAEKQLFSSFISALDSNNQGCLNVLRHGFKCSGKPFIAAYFQPASGLNPETEALYKANKLTVTRQLHFSEKDEKSLDLVLSLNGIPIVTAELKNPMTGQNFDHAIKQYKFDRDPRELIFQFKKRGTQNAKQDSNPRND